MKTGDTCDRRAFLRRAGSSGIGLLLARTAVTARARDRLTVGRPAPPLTLETLEGGQITTASLLGQVVILSFWATWCEPCREELPLLSRFKLSHARDGLAVLGFSLDGPEDLDDVRKVAAGLSFPVGLLGSAYAGGYGRIWHLPVNFTITRGGLLADNGWDDEEPSWTENRLQRIVEPLLAEAR